MYYKVKQTKKKPHKYYHPFCSPASICASAMPREKKVNKRRKKTRGPGWSIYLLVDGRVGREHADSIIVPYGIVPA